MDELGAATEKGVDAAKHLHHEHRLIHTLLHLIGRSEGPMAAGAMAAVGAAAGGGMMLGVQAVSMFGEAIKQTVEEIKKLKEEARTAFTDIQTLTNQTKTAMDDLKFASDNYWDGLARKSADSGVKAAFAGELAQIGLMTTAAKNLVVELQKAGLITAEQADKKTADDDAAGKAAEAAAKAKRAGELGENITALSEQAKKLQEEKSGERAAQIMNEQENISQKLFCFFGYFSS